jgi:hypothetical protein
MRFSILIGSFILSCLVYFDFYDAGKGMERL